MTDEPDIKDLLGRAFDREPPLGIDRDEVLQAGRKRLRRRHVLASSGVVAAVVVAAVGAAALTTLPDAGPALPPAASTTTSRPAPGLELPLTSRPTPSAPTTTGTPDPPSTDGSTTAWASGEYGTQLTQALYQSGVVSRDNVKERPGERDPVFQFGDGVYQFTGDIIIGSASGELMVTVERVQPGGVISCDDVPSPYIGCRTPSEAIVPVVVASSTDVSGERRNLAMVVLPDGTRVTAVASNTPSWEQAEDASASPPVLPDDALVRLITKSPFDAG